MKFLFPSSSSSSVAAALATKTTSTCSTKKKFHENLFKCSKLEESSDEYDGDEYINENECNQLDLNDLSLPLTDTIAEFVQELSEDKFFLNDISFLFELSRKRAISPCAIVVALIYLKRLKNKTKQSLYELNPLSSVLYNSNNKYSASCLSNTELCLISLLLASKYLVDEGEDDEIYNDQWAELVDYSVDKINKMERSILKQLNWELYVSENEFWSFTKQLTERITRKKVKYQHYQCTYTDLDYLLSNSSQFSLNTMKTNLNYLTKIILICSSTIVYMALSSFIISSCIFHLKNQLNLINTSTDLVSEIKNNSTTNKLLSVNNNKNNNLIVMESNELVLEPIGKIDQTLRNKTNLNPANSTLYDTFCSLNEKLSTSLFKLFENNKQKQDNLFNFMKRNHHNHNYPLNSFIHSFILK